jgi:hypothetical protein
MEIAKLYKVVKDINEKIQSTGILEHFNTIIQNLTKLGQQAQITAQARQQLVTSIGNSRREITSAINTFIPTTLTVEENEIYETLDAYNLFGYDGQQRLTNIFSEVQSNPNNAKTQLQQYQSELNRITQLYTSLSTYADKLPLDKVQQTDKDSIIIFFQGGAEIDNLDELAKVSTKWNQNLIAFALLTEENDRTFRIETVERGSIILTLSAMPAIAYGFAKATDKVLDVIKKYYEIKKLAHDAKQLKGIVPEKTIQDLEAASKLKLKAETNEITTQLIEEYGWNADGKEQRKDVDTAVRLAVRQLLDFVNKGGKLDVKLIAQNNETNKEMEMNLTIKYNDIKQIEKQVTGIDGQSQMLELSDGEEKEDDDETKQE